MNKIREVYEIIELLGKQPRPRGKEWISFVPLHDTRLTDIDNRFISIGKYLTIVSNSCSFGHHLT